MVPEAGLPRQALHTAFVAAKVRLGNRPNGVIIAHSASEPAAELLRARVGAPVPADDQQRNEQHSATARARRAEPAFGATKDEGNMTSVDELLSSHVWAM